MASLLPIEWLQWLYNVLQPEYKNPKFTYQDVAITLQSFPSLKVRTKIYTDENGIQELLLSLYGTIPSSYGSKPQTAANGASASIYRIPIEIWIPKVYPEVPPIIYVAPTSNEMVIQPGNYVDTNGKFYNPYLSYWKGFDPSSNLIKLCNLLSECFSKELPIYTRSQQQQSQLQLPLRPQNSGPVPPPKPALPSQIAGQQQQALSASATGTGPPQYNYDKYQSPPPLPAKPGKPVFGQDAIANLTTEFRRLNAQLSGSGSASPSQNAPASRATPPLPERVHAVAGHLLPQQQYLRQRNVVGQGPLHQPPQYQLQPTGSPAPAPVIDLMDSSDILPSTNSNTDAVQSNTNKLRDDVSSKLIAMSKQTIEPFFVAQDTKLTQINQSIDQFESILRYEKSVLQNFMSDISVNQQILTAKIQEAKETVSKAKEFQEPDVEEIICAETVVFNQLYRLVADIKAIDDTIYCLMQLHDKGKISLDAFMKHTRALARDQFGKKALVKKILETQ